MSSTRATSRTAARAASGARYREGRPDECREKQEEFMFHGGLLENQLQANFFRGRDEADSKFRQTIQGGP